MARGQVLVRLGVAAEVRALYTRAGQFVELLPKRADGGVEKGFFALANAPFEGSTLDLLVRTDATSGGEAAALLMALPVGSSLASTPPLGAGFPLERIGERAVRVVATGTALAPARAAIVSLLAEGKRVLSLDYGVRTPAHVALAADLDGFREKAVEVAVHYSEPDADGEGVVGALAHHALARRWTLASPRGEAVIAVGQLEMVAEVRAHWRSLGGDPADVLHNY